MANKVYIVLLNYNGFLDTMECLESVLKLDYENFQIIVVDNSETQAPFENLINWALGNLTVKETAFENLVFPLMQKPVDFCTISEEEFLDKELNHKIVFVKNFKKVPHFVKHIPFGMTVSFCSKHCYSQLRNKKLLEF